MTLNKTDTVNFSYNIIMKHCSLSHYLSKHTSKHFSNIYICINSFSLRLFLPDSLREIKPSSFISTDDCSSTTVDKTVIVYCWLALSRHKKNKLETVQWQKLRKWNVITDLHWKNFSKSQVSVMRRFWVICQNVSRKFIELCMETPCWCTTLVHQHGRQIIWNSFLRWKRFLFARELLYMRINTSPKT